ncbi:hypothetical protein Trydic_g22976 [Trypoxylus dichotomus]
MASTGIVVAPAVFVILMFLSPAVNCIDDYCSDNLINTNTSHMQFTKETSGEEFGVVKKFKGLHCCAKGYRSIEWVKNGVSHPWSGTLSSFILYPESANQTIYAQNVNSFDAGNYTCILRNDSVVVTHTIQLVVYDADSIPDDPKTTYISPDTEVVPGQSVRLFCEGFVGYVDLPDATSEAVWMKNNTIVEGPHITQQKVEREHGLTFGTYLFIDKVKPEDYGTYVCKISKPGKSRSLEVELKEKEVPIYLPKNPVPVKKLLWVFSILAILLITVFAIYLRYGLTARVCLKDQFGILEEDDGKNNDVLIVYSPKDEELALGTMSTILENRYHYKCTSRQLPSDIHLWYTSLLEATKRSRRIVAVISPATLNQNWDSRSMYEALKQLQAFNDKLTCVLLKDVPRSEMELKNSAGETLSSIIQRMNVVHWQRDKEDKFWLSLRLRLPPKRNGEMNVGDNSDANTLRLRNGYGESLDELV